MDANALLGMPAGLYRGLVTGLESGECSARIRVRRVPGGCLAVDYEALSEREGLQHAEHTLVVPDGLYVAITEMPGVSFFRLAEPNRFTSSVPGPYVMEIHADYADGQLTWAWHWAEAGQPPREMSRAVCRPADF
jgi:hypothetical protein